MFAVAYYVLAFMILAVLTVIITYVYERWEKSESYQRFDEYNEKLSERYFDRK